MLCYFCGFALFCIEKYFFSSFFVSGSLAENSKLRHVEKDVLIPVIMRDRAKELCSDKVQAFTKCCKETGFLMVVKCRKENTALKDCLVGYYSDPSFYEECKTEYLKQREEYRATGIKKKKQKITSNI
uniref:COX assembly mitochondrial protein n=1 Tax=Anser brachyrhynchus TaxID=132585 RepID=A0A8B9BI78_9AVES